MSIKKTFLWLTISVILILVCLGGSFLFLRSNKDLVRNYVLEKVQDNISGKVSIGGSNLYWDGSFPLLTAELSDVLVLDSLYSVHKQKLLEAEKVEVKINAWKLIFGTVSIQQIFLNGVHIHLLKTDNGYENVNIFKYYEPYTQKDPSKKLPSISVQKLEINDLQFVLEDLQEGKLISFSVLKASSSLFPSDTALHFQLKGLAHSDGLQFYKAFGPYLANADIDLDVKGYLNPSIPQINFTGTNAKILGANYHVDGWISPTDTASMDMHIWSDEARLELVVPYLTDTISNTLKKIQVAHAVKGHMRIYGPLIPRVDPKIDLIFSTQNNSISYLGMPLTLTGVGFQGHFINNLNPAKNPSDPNSLMQIDNFKGYLGSIPIQANAEIEDFIHPKLSVKGHLADGFENLDEYTELLPVENLKGEFSVDFSLVKADLGALGEFSKSNKIKDLTGEVTLRNVAFNYKNSASKIQSINAKLKIEDNFLYIKSLDVDYSGNTMHVKGKFIGLFPYLFQPKNSLKADLKVYSEDFVVDRLLTKAETKNQKAFRKRKSQKKRKVDKEAEMYARNLHFQIHLNADKLSFRKLKANKVKGLIIHTGISTEVKNLKLNTQGGSIEIDCKLSPLIGPKMFFNSVVLIKNVDVNQLFTSMDNFGQKVISADNISGKFSAKIHYSAYLNQDFAIDPNTMAGSFDFQLHDGHLMNFEPLVQLSNFLFKKRHLDNIQFDEISNQISLQGKQITIPDMPVSTSAFSFYLKGNYNFKDSTNLEIKVPFANFSAWQPSEETQQYYADSTKTNLLISAKTIDKKLHFGFGVNELFK